VDAFRRLDAVVANAGFSAHDTLADGDPGPLRSCKALPTGLSDR